MDSTSSDPQVPILRSVFRWFALVGGALAVYVAAYALLHRYEQRLVGSLGSRPEDDYAVLGPLGGAVFAPINAIHRRLRPHLWDVVATPPSRRSAR